MNKFNIEASTRGKIIPYQRSTASCSGLVKIGLVPAGADFTERDFGHAEPECAGSNAPRDPGFTTIDSYPITENDETATKSCRSL